MAPNQISRNAALVGLVLGGLNGFAVESLLRTGANAAANIVAVSTIGGVIMALKVSESVAEKTKNESAVIMATGLATAGSLALADCLLNFLRP